MARKSKKNVDKVVEENQTTENEVSVAAETENTDTTDAAVADNPAVESSVSAESETSEVKEDVSAAVVEEPVAEESVTENKSVEETESAAETTVPPVTENESVKVEEKKQKKGRRFGPSFEKQSEVTTSNGPLIFFTCVGAFFVMLLATLVIFLVNVKGAEQVLVPDVVGKQLDQALLELQVKELYPRITLRYSNSPSEKGMILEQSPVSGSIVKGYSRINLFVSRGVVTDEVDEYTGKIYSDVQKIVEEMNAGQENPMVTLAEPRYVANTRPAGTIIEQNPLPGTEIYGPVSIEFVVSRGPTFENPKTPAVKGLSVNDMLQTIASSRVIYEISAHEPVEGETAGTVTGQQAIKSKTVANYSRVTVDMAMPSEPVNNMSYGVFTAEVAEYPFPVEMAVDVVPLNAPQYRLVTFNQPGGKVTVPYCVPAGSELKLSVKGKVHSSQTAQTEQSGK